MKLRDEEAGEILVVRDESASCIALHVRGMSPDAYRVVRLNRREARRLAALILFQAERLGETRLAPAAKLEKVGLKIA